MKGKMGVSDNVSGRINTSSNKKISPRKYLIEQVLCIVPILGISLPDSVQPLNYQFDPARFFHGLGICVLALLLGVILDGDLAGRVLAYLERAESRESDAWYRDDIRMAWMVVRFLQKCLPGDPYVNAGYILFGVHPANLPKKIEARRRALLGSYYEAFFPSPELSPKKPAVSLRINVLTNRRAA